MNSEIKQCFDNYPNTAQKKLIELRTLILSVAVDLKLGDVDECLKWGEPSYSVKTGSPIRIDWKPKHPENYFLFFNCQTKLIDTFRELYQDTLEFQGNRAIVLNINQPLPIAIITKCLTLALTYKKRKHLPLLGA